MQSVVLVTTKQPSSNPRLVKEALALSENGYTVTVVYNYWSDWAKQADKLIFDQAKKITWIKAGPDPVNSSRAYWLTRLRFKLFKILRCYFKNNHWINVNAATQFYPELKKRTSALKADLYIAHNAGALAVASNAANNNASRYAFDAEDFHRSQDDKDTEEGQLAKYLEDVFLVNAVYVTAASPLISAAYKDYYPLLQFTVINNVFSKQLQSVLATLDLPPLKLFWFSQTVGLKRGLQDVIGAMNLVNTGSIRLTILGDATDHVKQLLSSMLYNSLHQIEFVAPCNEVELFKMAAAHHIGLALEPGFSLNNNIALSNKLFTYLIAGNAVILSATAAQRSFFQEYPGIGWCYNPGDVEALKLIITESLLNAPLLNTKRSAAWELAGEKLNWETEQQTFLQLVKSII